MGDKKIDEKYQFDIEKDWLDARAILEEIRSIRRLMVKIKESIDFYEEQSRRLEQKSKRNKKVLEISREYKDEINKLKELFGKLNDPEKGVEADIKKFGH